jgi:hypothetical protein
MVRQALLDCTPLALGLVLVIGALAAIARVARRDLTAAAARSGRLWSLHADQAGGVQSLSFVLTAPVFVMLMLLAVQITQLMIGLMTTHYAAYAAARAAVVWIPARLDPGAQNGENRIGIRTPIARYADGWEYRIEPGSEKYERIRRAAALACLSAAPSRDWGPAATDATTGSLQAMYALLAPASSGNPRIPRRLANKWAWSNAATSVEIHTFHRDDEPPLIQYPPYLPESEFTNNEIGWRDPIQVTVTHHFALLPGPGRLLARRANETYIPDTIAPQILSTAGVYYVPLKATATLVGEGEKSTIPYVQQNL